MVFSGSLRRPRFSRASGMHLCIFRYFSIPVLANEKLQKLQFSLLRISILKLFNTCNSNFVLCGFGQKVRVREHFPQHKSGLWKTPSDHSSAWTSNFAQDFSHHFHMKRRRWIVTIQWSIVKAHTLLISIMRLRRAKENAKLIKLIEVERN